EPRGRAGAVGVKAGGGDEAACPAVGEILRAEAEQLGGERGRASVAVAQQGLHVGDGKGAVVTRRQKDIRQRRVRRQLAVRRPPARAERHAPRGGAPRARRPVAPGPRAGTRASPGGGGGGGGAGAGWGGGGGGGAGRRPPAAGVCRGAAPPPARRRRRNRSGN